MNRVAQLGAPIPQSKLTSSRDPQGISGRRPTSASPHSQFDLASVLTNKPTARDTSPLDGFLECGAEIKAHGLLLLGTTEHMFTQKVVPKWSQSGPATKKPAGWRVVLG